MKSIINAFVYALMFVALQAMAGLGVHAVWQQVAGGTDITVMELVVTMAVFSALTILVFLSARWAEVSPRWLLTKQWTVLVWAVIAALGMVIPFSWLQENMPELPNWIENQQEQLLSNYWGYVVSHLSCPFRPDSHESCADSLCLPCRMAAGLDVLAYRLYPAWHGVSLGKQLCCLYHLPHLSRPRYETHRPF